MCNSQAAQPLLQAKVRDSYVAQGEGGHGRAGKSGPARLGALVLESMVGEVASGTF